MGLPPALAARLAKRGIKVENRKKEDEEVFAEDKITAILDEFGKKLPKNWDKVCVGVCSILNGKLFTAVIAPLTLLLFRHGIHNMKPGIIGII